MMRRGWPTRRSRRSARPTTSRRRSCSFSDDLRRGRRAAAARPTAADLRFQAAGLSRTARYEPDEDAALPAFDDWAQLPSWYEAVDVLLAAWLAEPAVERVRTALEAAERAVERAPEPPLLCPALIEFLRARMGEGDARRAADAFRQIGVPAWLARALPVLGEDAEAEALERQLGVI